MTGGEQETSRRDEWERKVERGRAGEDYRAGDERERRNVERERRLERPQETRGEPWRVRDELKGETYGSGYMCQEESRIQKGEEKSKESRR